MRKAFVNALVELGHKDERVVLLAGDLGYSVLESFMEKFPSRFYDAGVAEQNMTGVAAGLALSGKVVFIYSIVPFVTYRCYEQIRNDLCYHNLDVRIVGIGGGLSYGTAGSTHHSIEDIGALRVLPNLTIVAPGDPVETALAVKASSTHCGPIYFRLGKGGEPVVHKKVPKFGFGRGIVTRNGDDVTIISTGNMTIPAVAVCEQLEQQRVAVRHISMHTVKPIDSKLICSVAKPKSKIVTLEEHNLIGGLGSAVSEVLADNEIKADLLRIGLPDSFMKRIGSQETLRKINGLDESSVFNKIIRFIGK